MKLVCRSLMRFVSAGVLIAAVWPSAAMAANDVPAPARESRDAAAVDSQAARQRAAAVSDKDQEEIAAFMRQFAPARWAAVESLPETGAVRRGVMVYVVARWRQLQILREDDPALYELKVRQMTVEDTIYGLLARTRSPTEREPLRKNLRERVAERLKLDLAEREHRIERLRQSLKVEEDRLAKDQRTTDQMIDRRVDAFVADGPGTLHPDLPRRPRRPPGATTTPGPEEKLLAPAGN